MGDGSEIEVLDYGGLRNCSGFAGPGFPFQSVRWQVLATVQSAFRDSRVPRFQPLGRRRNQPRINYAQPDRPVGSFFGTFVRCLSFGLLLQSCWLFGDREQDAARSRRKDRVECWTEGTCRCFHAQKCIRQQQRGPVTNLLVLLADLAREKGRGLRMLMGDLRCGREYLCFAWRKAEHPSTSQPSSLCLAPCTRQLCAKSEDLCQQHCRRQSSCPPQTSLQQHLQASNLTPLNMLIAILHIYGPKRNSRRHEIAAPNVHVNEEPAHTPSITGKAYVT